MKTRKEPENPEIVETAEVAEAPGAEPKEEITFPENCVYCGPSVKGVAKQYTVYTGGNIPAPLRDFVQQHPAARGLVVAIGRFAKMRQRLETPGTAEAMLFQKVKSEL